MYKLCLCLVTIITLLKNGSAWCPVTFRTEETFSLGIDENGITCHHEFGMCAVHGSPQFQVFMDVLQQKYGRGVRNNECAGLVRRPWSRDAPAPFVPLPTDFIRLTRFALKFELSLNTSLEENAFSDLTTLEVIQLVDVSSMASRCIANCNELSLVSFRDMRLARFPKDAIFKCPKMRTIDITKTKITKFEDGAFSTLSNLLELNFRDSRVKFGTRPFTGLSRLTKLSLNYLDLNQIVNTWFTPLYNLKHLELIANNLKQIDANHFSSLAKIISLSLKFNQLTTIANMSFDNLSQLTSLDISNNRLTEMVAISGGHKLKYVKADNNRISRISSNLYCSTPMFEVISLEHNPIDQLVIVEQPNCFNQKALFVAKYGIISKFHHAHLRTVAHAYDHMLKDLLTCDCAWNWINEPTEYDDERAMFFNRKCNQTDTHYEHPILSHFLDENCLGTVDLRALTSTTTTTTTTIPPTTVTDEIIAETTSTTVASECTCTPSMQVQTTQGSCSKYLTEYESCLAGTSEVTSPTSADQLDMSFNGTDDN